MITVFCFVGMIYLYPRIMELEQNEHNNEVINKLNRIQRLIIVFVIMLGLYSLDECIQLLGKCYYLHRSHLNGWIFMKISINHFFGDFWNFIDMTVIITGIIGAFMRYRALTVCLDHGDCRNEYHKTLYASNCILAVTAVMLWFKVLYFLRPTKSSGQFGKSLHCAVSL